jgi:predicted nucleic-acid-binding Zn-ribbon protein
MGLDIYIYRNCPDCKYENVYELHRSDDGKPFDINNEQHWRLLEKYFKADIADRRKAFRTNREERDAWLADRNLDEDRSERRFIAEELKFVDDGCFIFMHCEKCGKALDVVVFSQ